MVITVRPDQGPVSGTATVDKLVGERGVWLTGKDGQQRLFAVLDKDLTGKNLQAGQKVRVAGIAYAGTDRSAVAPQQLEPEAQEALEGQEIFVHVNELSILGGEQQQAQQTGGETAQRSDPQKQAGEGDLSLAEIAKLPEEKIIGQTVNAVGRVVDVDTDRGFWLEAGDDRLFAILAKRIDTPDSKTAITDDSRIRLTGTVMNAREASEVEELKPVWAEANKILANEDVFLRVTEVEVLER